MTRGDDPEGVYPRATVDMEDVEDVVEVVRERLLALQVEQRLPLFVIPLEPLAPGGRERPPRRFPTRGLPAALP